MNMKKQKKKRLSTRSDPKNLTYRTLSIRQDGPGTIDTETRSVEVIGATEDPVEVFDYERYAIVPEILLMSGCQIPTTRQVPLLDTHMRYESKDVLGSYRDMKIEGDKLLGRSYFSKVPEAEGSWIRVQEGHLTDFSVGYQVNESIWIPEKEKQSVAGREFTGPLRVVTKWTPRELSVCPIGADQRAKARSYTTPKEKDEEMDKLREFLALLGMPAEATDEQMRAFMDGIIERAAKKPEPKKDQESKAYPEKERAEAVRAERARITEITAMCRQFEMPEKEVTRMIDEDVDIHKARELVMKHLADQKKDPAPPDGHRYETGKDEKQKFREAAEGAVLIRSGIPGDHGKIAGASDLAGYSLVEMARHALLVNNLKSTGNPLEMIGRALTTSDFPYILANVANKSLFAGWEGAGETWNQWCDTGRVSDFKTHSSARISEFDDLDELPENAEYEYGNRTEAKEEYRVVTYGKMAGISRQAIINDDLDAITRNFMGMGEAAARKVGDLPYAVLTGNPTMGDGKALFHTDHSNLVAGGSGAAPGIATLDAAFLAMGTQKDLKEKRLLNIRPVYLLAPMALRGTAEMFFTSERYADVDTAGTSDENVATTRRNIYAGNVLTRIYDARLDASDTAAWFLAAAKGKTVTVFFLNGNQTPYMEQQQGWSVDGTEFKVRIDAGAKAMDWRGLYMNDGN
jgi:hypothetical protein